MNTIPASSSTHQLSASASSMEQNQPEQGAAARQIPERDSVGAEAGAKGKHIAQRDVTQWLDYGDPKEWDLEFENAVVSAVDGLNKGSLESKNFIKHFEEVRRKIAAKRRNEEAHLFGLRRDSMQPKEASMVYVTHLRAKHKAYGYALKRAIEIPYDDSHYLHARSQNGKFWTNKYFYDRGATGPLRYGLVVGYIDSKRLPLTQYIFCRREENQCEASEKAFGAGDSNYVGDNKESAIWLHTSREFIPVVYYYLQMLIDKAINRNLSVIPSIHWWYVHLAPTCRGSGGIAEMMTNTLCRYHGIDLPPWKDGVAPSVETLLEPNEENFCANYHKLFAFNQDELKEHFKKIEM